MKEKIKATCHCGLICISLSLIPDELTKCNCSLCRSYGVVWAYYTASDIVVSEGPTDTYAWNGKHVDFHRCHTCGCLTHWTPRDKSRDKRGVNANLIPVKLLTSFRIRHRDGAGDAGYLD